MTRPITPALLPMLTQKHLLEIWIQLPQTRRTQLSTRLFFLTLEKAGGMSYEDYLTSPLSQSPSQDRGAASQEIGADLRAPILALSRRESSGESEEAVSIN